MSVKFAAGQTGPWTPSGRRPQVGGARRGRWNSENKLGRGRQRRNEPGRAGTGDHATNATRRRSGTVGRRTVQRSVPQRHGGHGSANRYRQFCNPHHGIEHAVGVRWTWSVTRLQRDMLQHIARFVCSHGARSAKTLQLDVAARGKRREKNFGKNFSEPPKFSCTNMSNPYNYLRWLAAQKPIGSD